MSLYQSDILNASSKVTLDQARLAIRLSKDTNHIRKAFLKEMSGPRPPPKSGQQWARSISALKSAGVNLSSNANPPSKNKARKVLKRIERQLHTKQQRQLTSDLPLQPSNPLHGRGSAGIFNSCVAPLHKRGQPRRYSEWVKLDVVNPAHKKAVKKIITGQLDCATRRAQWSNPNLDLACPCGGGVQDPYHVVMECPHTAPTRKAVIDTVQSHAMSDSLLSSLIAGQSEESVLKATLGAPLCGPWKNLGVGPYNTLVDLASPVWAKRLSHLL